jgi:hypothetical protein
MQVKNINELHLPFPLQYQGKTITIHYREVVELKDGTLDMKGIPGWLICRPSPIAIPPIQPIPNIIEIDLSPYVQQETSNEKINKGIDSKENKGRKEEMSSEGRCSADYSETSQGIPSITEDITVSDPIADIAESSSYKEKDIAVSANEAEKEEESIVSSPQINVIDSSVIPAASSAIVSEKNVDVVSPNVSVSENLGVVKKKKRRKLKRKKKSQSISETEELKVE